MWISICPQWLSRGEQLYIIQIVYPDIKLCDECQMYSHHKSLSGFKLTLCFVWLMIVDWSNIDPCHAKKKNYWVFKFKVADIFNKSSHLYYFIISLVNLVVLAIFRLDEYFKKSSNIIENVKCEHTNHRAYSFIFSRHMSAVLRLWNNLGLVYLPRSVCKIFHSFDFFREGSEEWEWGGYIYNL